MTIQINKSALEAAIREHSEVTSTRIDVVREMVSKGQLSAISSGGKIMLAATSAVRSTVVEMEKPESTTRPLWDQY